MTTQLTYKMDALDETADLDVNLKQEQFLHSCDINVLECDTNVSSKVIGSALIIKSETFDSEDEMERQYISFDDDNVVFNHEEVVTTELEDPVEKAMQFMFESDNSKIKEVSKKSPKRTKQKRGQPDPKRQLKKSVERFLLPRKELPVSVTPPKKKKKQMEYQFKKIRLPKLIPPPIIISKKTKEKLKQVSTLDTPPTRLKLSFKDTTPLRCIVCQEDCANKRELIVHVKSHSRDKNSFECPECQKTFAQQCNLKRHIRCHSGERPYTCPFCQKLFSDQGYLTTHLRYHTNTKPYTCNQCKKSFFDRSNYIKHLRSHTGEKPYSCLTCKKSFLQQSDLTRHSRTHSGERPFKCNYCERAFTQHGDLTTHLRHHTGERPYVCNNCQKTFANKRYLNSHVRGHICEKRPHSVVSQVLNHNSKVFVGLVEVVVDNETT